MLSAQDSQPPRTPAFDDIVRPVLPQLQALNAFLDNQVEQFESDIRDLVRYSLKNQGKRLRPLLVFFGGWKDGSVSDDLVRAAAVVEMTHLATLIHDDILDDATLRHNTDTVSARYGSAAAVLLGDALFSQALKMAAEFPTVEVCRAVSHSTRKVCAGEIRQTFERGNPDFSLEDYFRVIDLKTAELFAVSASLGASLAGYEKPYVEAVSKYSRHLGIAYQIFDDLADYLGDEDKIGKTLGTDLASGKFTLPVLVLLQRLPRGERKFFLSRIRRGELTPKHLVEQMKDYAVIAEVSTSFEQELKAAEETLAPYADLPPSKKLLELLAFVRYQCEKLAIG